MEESKICHLGKGYRANFLANNKILGQSKLKAFADDKIDVSEKLKFVLGKVESIVGKWENAGYQDFLLFPKCFQKRPFSAFKKFWFVSYRVKAPSINPLPNDKILDQTKLKALQTTNVTKMIISVFDWVENIMGKGDIGCSSNFSYSHNVFKKLIS